MSIVDVADAGAGRAERSASGDPRKGRCADKRGAVIGRNANRHHVVFERTRRIERRHLTGAAFQGCLGDSSAKRPDVLQMIRYAAHVDLNMRARLLDHQVGFLRMKAVIASTYASAWVTCGMWPAPGNVTTDALGSTSATFATTGANVGGLWSPVVRSDGR